MNINDINKIPLLPAKAGKDAPKPAGKTKDLEPAHEVVQDIYDNSLPVSVTTRNNKVTPLMNSNDIFDQTQEMIKSAKESINIEMYDFADKDLAQLLIDQKKKGVDIKVLLDPCRAEGDSMSEAREEVVNMLSTNGIPVLTYTNDRGTNSTDHCKLMIVDNKAVLLGGMNWNPLSRRNHDTMVKIEGTAANYYNYHFAEGWNITGGTVKEDPYIPQRVSFRDKKGGGKALVKGIRTSQGDTTAKTAILDAINSAKESVFVEMYVLSDKNTIDALVNAHNDGLDVRVILDPNHANTNWSPNDATFKTLKDAGVPVRWYKVDPGQRAHGKWAVVDRESVIVGSPNWSARGFHHNREIGAIIKDDETSDVFSQQFFYDWRYKASEEYPL